MQDDLVHLILAYLAHLILAHLVDLVHPTDRNSPGSPDPNSPGSPDPNSSGSPDPSSPDPGSPGYEAAPRVLAPPSRCLFVTSLFKCSVIVIVYLIISIILKSVHIQK